MEKLVPLISGSRTGPLGIAHLPRFWLKMRAHAAGLLEKEYRHGNGGTDEDLLTTFGIDGDAFADFIATETPDYLACEAWVRANAKALAPEKIFAFTEYWRTFVMPDPRRSEWTARFGVSPSFGSAIGFNQLDDWDLVHHQLRAPDQPKTPLVPAISSAVAGPIGILHLPRLWIKRRVHAAGRLPEGYRLGLRGFDGTLTETLGIDYDALAAFIDTERPDYLATEAWVRTNATSLNADTVAGLNARILSTKLPDQYVPGMRARVGVDDSYERSVPLNDLDDWLTLHEQLKAVAAV